jgi:3-isopropylmalate/(R)-2-methylmalate dehydratase small subunit
MGDLFDRYARSAGAFTVTIDLEQGTVTDGSGFSARFALDPYRRDMLLRGLDEIGLTLTHEEAIDRFERSRARRLAGVGE